MIHFFFFFFIFEGFVLARLFWVLFLPFCIVFSVLIFTVLTFMVQATRVGLGDGTI